MFLDRLILNSRNFKFYFYFAISFIKLRSIHRDQIFDQSFDRSLWNEFSALKKIKKKTLLQVSVLIILLNIVLETVKALEEINDQKRRYSEVSRVIKCLRERKHSWPRCWGKIHDIIAVYESQTAIPLFQI